MALQAFAPGTLEQIKSNQQNSPGAILSKLVSGVTQGFIDERQKAPVRRKEFLKTTLDFVDKGINPMTAIQQARGVTGFNEPLGTDANGLMQELSALSGRKRELEDLELQTKQASLAKTKKQTDKFASEIQSKGQTKFPKTVFNQARDVGKEFRANPVVKQFDEIQRAVKGLESGFKLATDPNTKSRLAADQTLGVTFQKMLDPTSVVRESEYARTPEGASFINQWAGKFKALSKGGIKITDNDRFEIVRQGRKLLESTASLYNEKFDVFSNISKAQGLPQEVVFGGIDKFDISAIGDNLNNVNDTANINDTTGTPNTGGDIVLPDGRRFKIIGKDLNGNDLLEEVEVS